MDIKRISIEQIHFAPYNPRVMEDAEFEKLKSSIITFGYQDPMIMNSETGNVIGGNQRLRALIDLGFKEVEVVVVSLSLAKEKVFNIALNKISGRFDLEKLTPLLEEISKIPDIEFELTGFEPPELSELLDRYNEAKEDDFDFKATVESIKKPVTQRGDVIILGTHRIMCGDSACESDLNVLMQDEKIDLVQTDPPYGCLYLAQNRPDLESRPKKSKRWEKLYKDDLNEKEYEEWIKSVLKNMRRYLKDGAVAYIWNGHAKFYFVHQVLRELGFHVSTVITWAKPTFAISYGDFNQQTEFCLYSWLKNAPHKWHGPTNESSLWFIARNKASELIHPTQKSVEIPARAIRNSSVRGDIVFDGFLGSGSTLIAAESLERRCFGMEIEPKYCDAIVRRYIAYAPNKVSTDIVKRYIKETNNE